MVDEGELDWKIVAIDVNDKMASQMSDITDVDDHVISGTDTSINCELTEVKS